MKSTKRSLLDLWAGQQADTRRGQRVQWQVHVRRTNGWHLQEQL